MELMSSIGCPSAWASSNSSDDENQVPSSSNIVTTVTSGTPPTSGSLAVEVVDKSHYIMENLALHYNHSSSPLKETYAKIKFMSVLGLTRVKFSSNPATAEEDGKRCTRRRSRASSGTPPSSSAGPSGTRRTSPRKVKKSGVDGWTYDESKETTDDDFKDDAGGCENSLQLKVRPARKRANQPKDVKESAPKMLTFSPMKSFNRQPSPSLAVEEYVVEEILDKREGAAPPSSSAGPSGTRRTSPRKVKKSGVDGWTYDESKETIDNDFKDDAGECENSLQLKVRPARKRANQPKDVKESAPKMLTFSPMKSFNRQPSPAVAVEEYVVEEILDKREGAAGIEEYLIKWEGYSKDWNSWEPRENISEVAVLEYERTHTRNRGKKITDSRINDSPESNIDPELRWRPKQNANVTATAPAELELKPDDKILDTPEGRNNDSERTAANDFDHKLNMGTGNLLVDESDGIRIQNLNDAPSAQAHAQAQRIPGQTSNPVFEFKTNLECEAESTTSTITSQSSAFIMDKNNMEKLTTNEVTESTDSNELENERPIGMDHTVEYILPNDAPELAEQTHNLEPKVGLNKPVTTSLETEFKSVLMYEKVAGHSRFASSDSSGTTSTSGSLVGTSDSQESDKGLDSMKNAENEPSCSKRPRRVIPKKSSSVQKPLVTKRPGRTNRKGWGGQFLVEAILDTRVERNGKISYLLKWQGYSNKYNSWEPTENISPDMIAYFEKTRAEKENLDGEIMLEPEESTESVDPLPDPTPNVRTTEFDGLSRESTVNAGHVLLAAPSGLTRRSPNGERRFDDEGYETLRTEINLAGRRVRTIRGATHYRNKIYFAVGFEGQDPDQYTLVKGNDMKLVFPQEVLRFYEERIAWTAMDDFMDLENVVIQM